MGLCPWMPLLWVVLAELCAACGGRLDGLLTPSSSGRPYEILVVANPAVWEHPAGRALWSALDTDVPGLPQPERAFRLMRTAPRNFDATLRLTRNILVLDLDKEKYPQASFTYARDVYAAPQLVVTLRAPDEDSLKAVLARCAASLPRLFTQEERKRRVAWLADHHSAYVAEQVKEQFACEVWVPAGLASYKTGRNFFWASTNAPTEDENFVMYAYPYTGAEAFTKAGFIHKRDSVMKQNIPGAEPDMYMATDTLCTSVRPIVVKGQYAMEMRGLWMMENDAMGGPFVSHSRVDTLNNRVVVVEGFVYAPQKKKGNLMRSLESALYTLCLPGEQPRELKASIPEVSVTAGKKQE